MNKTKDKLLLQLAFNAQRYSQHTTQPEILAVVHLHMCNAGVSKGAAAGLLELVDGGPLGGVALQQAQHPNLEDAQRP